MATFDTGADLTNPLIASHLWINPNEIPNNGFDDDHNGLTDDIHGVNWAARNGQIKDVHKFGHGTHVAGIILGANLEKSENFPIELMVFQYDPRNPSESMIDSLIYAEKFGVKIFNITFSQIIYPKVLEKDLLFKSTAEKVHSFNEIKDFYAYYGERAHQKLSHKTFNEDEFGQIFIAFQSDWHDAWNRVAQTICRLKDKMLIVVSAGNHGQDLNSVQLYPQTIGSSNMVVVMNLTSAHERYVDIDEGGSSNYGSNIVDVAAIGTDVKSIVPTTVFPSGKALMTGTSQAAPKISRFLAKILDQSPSPLSTDDLHRKMFESLSWNDRLNADTGTGWVLKENE